MIPTKIALNRPDDTPKSLERNYSGDSYDIFKSMEVLILKFNVPKAIYRCDEKKIVAEKEWDRPFMYLHERMRQTIALYNDHSNTIECQFDEPSKSVELSLDLSNWPLNYIKR